MNEKTIVLCVGHYRKSQGAVHPMTGITEWQVNRLLINIISAYLVTDNWKVTPVYNLPLPRKVRTVNELESFITIDLHCNAFDSSVKGHEVLYYQNSQQAELLAECITHTLSINHDRGAKPVIHEDGSYFLRQTRPVAVLVETCFIDLDLDFQNLVENITQTGKEIASGITNFYYMLNLLNKQGLADLD